jgi:hypothetical protein
MMKTPSLLPSLLPTAVLAAFLSLAFAAQAQAPAGKSTEDQLYQQRRTELRSALTVNARPGETARAPASPPRTLSADERRELRQQLRQQYRQPAKAKP